MATTQTAPKDTQEKTDDVMAEPGIVINKNLGQGRYEVTHTSYDGKQIKGTMDDNDHVDAEDRETGAHLRQYIIKGENGEKRTVSKQDYRDALSAFVNSGSGKQQAPDKDIADKTPGSELTPVSGKEEPEAKAPAEKEKQAPKTGKPSAKDDKEPEDDKSAASQGRKKGKKESNPLGDNAFGGGLLVLGLIGAILTGNPMMFLAAILGSVAGSAMFDENGVVNQAMGNGDKTASPNTPDGEAQGKGQTQSKGLGQSPEQEQNIVKEADSKGIVNLKDVPDGKAVAIGQAIGDKDAVVGFRGVVKDNNLYISETHGFTKIDGEVTGIDITEKYATPIKVAIAEDGSINLNDPALKQLSGARERMASEIEKFEEKAAAGKTTPEAGKSSEGPETSAMERAKAQAELVMGKTNFRSEYKEAGADFDHGGVPNLGGANLGIS